MSRAGTRSLRALLALSLAPLPTSGPIVGHWLATALAYPPVALAIAGAGRLGSREAA